jgi:hypothetical protein
MVLAIQKANGILMVQVVKPAYGMLIIQVVQPAREIGSSTLA